MNQYDCPAPFSNDRVQYLESGVLEDYTDLTDEELKSEVQARNLMMMMMMDDLCCPRKNINYAKALQESDRRDLEKYRDWKLCIELPLRPSFQRAMVQGAKYESIMQARCRHMFQSAYKKNQNKLTFLDLPAEIRNRIYEFALIGVEWRTECTRWHMSEYDKQIPQRGQATNLAKFHQNLETYTLAMLGVMNKQIRTEAQSLFWAQCDFTLVALRDLQPATLQWFLNAIGLEGRASIPRLKFRFLDNDVDYIHESPMMLQDVLPTLVTCVNLRSLDLHLTVRSIFEGDPKALWEYLYRGGALDSRSLKRFVDTFLALPNLERVDLSMFRCYKHEYPNTKLFCHAFKGNCEVRLWKEMKEQLQAIDFGKENEPARKLAGRILVTMSFPSV